MTRTLFLAFVASMVAFGSAATAQMPSPAIPRPVTRADFIKRIDAGFAALDANHDGSWSRAELETAQTRAMQQRAQAQFKQLDTNHDGQLSFQEFAAGVSATNLKQIVDQVIQKLDANHDGKVTAEEARAPQLANFAKLDANHDGVVTPAEVQAFAKAHASQ